MCEPASAERARTEFGGRRVGKRALVDGHGAAISRVVPGDNGKNTRAVLGTAGHGTNLVHGRSKRHGAVTADAAVGRAQSADAAEGGRTNDGAPGFRAYG